MAVYLLFPTHLVGHWLECNYKKNIVLRPFHMPRMETKQAYLYFVLTSLPCIIYFGWSAYISFSITQQRKQLPWPKASYMIWVEIYRRAAEQMSQIMYVYFHKYHKNSHRITENDCHGKTFGFVVFCSGISDNPDSKVHGANMGPTWVLLAPCWPHDPCYQRSYLQNNNVQKNSLTWWE